MSVNRVKKIQEFEQSIWLDFIDRNLLSSGQLQKLIEEDGIKGLTSNPAIFEKAISSGNAYDEDIKKLSANETNNEVIFYEMAVTDIQQAADILMQVYDDKVKSGDGYISLEVSPYLAKDTKGTVSQALQLWKAIDRKNAMIKIPGTMECLPAIRTCISEGLNINVTLLFGLERYEAVTEAYISGLEDRVKSGKPLHEIASVASFFLSRIDILIDPLLTEKGIGELKGKIAIASAKMAYEIYKKVFSSERFLKLKEKGATPQRLLWASTSNKDASSRDTKYVEALIGPKTVNTIPMETLDAFRDHGEVKNTLEEDADGAAQILEQVKKGGINLFEITQKLEDEGIEKFTKPYDKMLQAIEKQKPALKTADAQNIKER